MANHESKLGSINFETGYISQQPAIDMGKTLLAQAKDLQDFTPNGPIIIRDSTGGDASSFLKFESVPQDVETLYGANLEEQACNISELGFTVCGTLVKVHIYLDDIFGMHTDPPDSITAAIGLLGEAELRTTDERKVIQPGTRFVVNNGRDHLDQPAHGIYSPSPYRTSLVVRTLFKR